MAQRLRRFLRRLALGYGVYHSVKMWRGTVPNYDPQKLKVIQYMQSVPHSAWSDAKHPEVCWRCQLPIKHQIHDQHRE